MITDHWKDILSVLRHIEIMHHIPGRIRLRVAMDFLKQADQIEGHDPSATLSSFPGILDVRFNRIAGSLVIRYDANQLTPRDWDLLIGGADQESEEVLNRMAQKLPIRGDEQEDDPALP